MFIDNKAKYSDGAIYLRNGHNYIKMSKNTTFLLKRAITNGGAIYTEDLYMLIHTNCKFIKNYAQNYDSGGVFSTSGDILTVNNSYFYKNKAGGYGGGAICEKYIHVTYIACTFIRNEIKDNGGGLCIIPTVLH